MSSDLQEAANARLSGPAPAGHGGAGRSLSGGARPRQSAAPPFLPPEASAIVDFWRNAGSALWFAKDAEFDRGFRERFLTLHEAAAQGELHGWLETPDGALALLVLLDQFPRNAFRGTPRMYASDPMAREIAGAAINSGHDLWVAPELQFFVYMPFAHSEHLADQERSLALYRRLGQPYLGHAEGHFEIVRRFGRF
ncbi:MAG: DUF924 family protein, partial [Beijerinckiaceae bacterium]|nr:DUF924 family protein [Beijerinckiaceae bacterium]